jgi:pimeloyl-ACP methyl ester carboxylesterase
MHRLASDSGAKCVVVEWLRRSLMQLAASLPHAQLVVIEHAAHAVSRDPGNVKWHLATTALWILRALKTAPTLLE